MKSFVRIASPVALFAAILVSCTACAPATATTSQVTPVLTPMLLPTPRPISTPTISGSQQGRSNAAATRTAASAIHIPTAVFTSLPTRDETAPPYEKIRRDIAVILERAPEFELHAPSEFRAYHNHLQHMRVVDWEGWIDGSKLPLGVIDEELEHYEVFIEIPDERSKGEKRSIIFSEIELLSVPGERATKLQEWHAAHKGVRWHKVRFSGRIITVNVGAQIQLYQSTIEPIE